MAGEIESLTIDPLVTHVVGHIASGVAKRVPVGARTLLMTGEAVAGAADTNANTLRSLVIPAGLLGAKGGLEIETLWSTTSSANNKVLTITFGAMSLLSATITTNTTARHLTTMFNRNDAAAQVAGPSVATSSLWGASNASLATGTVNTASDVTLSFIGQKASAGESLILQAVRVLYLPGVS